MKTRVIMMVSAMLIFSMAYGQKNSTERKPLKKLVGTSVNVASQNSFASDFGKLPNVEWRRGLMFDEATFTKNGVKMIAYYDENAKLVGTTQAKKFSDLPLKAQSEITTKYKDYSVGQIIFFDDNELNDTDMYLYGNQFEDEDNYFAELSKGGQKLVVKIDVKGDVGFFTKI